MPDRAERPAAPRVSAQLHALGCVLGMLRAHTHLLVAAPVNVVCFPRPVP